MKVLSDGFQQAAVILSLVLAPLFFFSACGAPINVKPLTAEEIPLVQAAGRYPQERYVIVPDDTLQIRYPFHPEMNQEAVVKPDGKITATLVGEVPVANMTTTALERLLVERTSDQLRNPEVVVNIIRFAERNVYVGGEVGKPGMVRYRKGLTPLQAIIASGGLLESARADSVVLVRTGESGNDFISRKLNLQESMAENIKEPIFLVPHDIVYVPKTSIAEANLWVKQYITDLFPFLRGSAGLTYRAGQ
ncbi:MAG TPA: polysaccharide biosynthesis/export family protein [Candidatus Binatia bacterium]|nr:polysaccharide biosynthesis/export family protein [Candidatus Binatia bacterium]